MNYWQILQRKKWTVILITAICVVIAVVITLSQTFKYGVKSKVLIVENFPPGTDIYTISRSKQYLGDVLAQVVLTNTFFHKVLSSSFNIEQSYFLAAGSNNEVKALKKWRQTVKTRSLDDTGIVEISVFHPNKYQAEQIAKAINYTLKTTHQQYHGNPNIVLNEIETPIASDKVVEPNVLINIASGLFFGLSLALFYVYLFGEKQAHLMVSNRKNRKSKQNNQHLQMQSTVDYYDQVSQNHNQNLKSSIRQPLEQQPGQPAFQQRPPQAVAMNAIKQNPAEASNGIDEAFENDSLPAVQSFQTELNGSMDNILG